ncbi:uncharacterized protein LOC128735386 [Sabethes cyaneus]|uniref:uncharacterized protein LOC128735386 n=1 Tax=Sabethes cyaneus TaxID=53552 RepID=UPI00237DB0E6|nr:uncharacterized protein LOC128735386 [Sabethes cyaneus]
MNQSHVRQTRSRTKAMQNTNLTLDDADKVSSCSSESSFIPSMIDIDGGEGQECIRCNRPNNAERYMVQCSNCNGWCHFTCANVNTESARSSSFVCGCVTNVAGRVPSVISGISETSSVRKARVERDLQRLQEEQKLLEDLEKERIEKERALVERELREKLERGKQFIARKHELLSQQDVDEVKSVRSMRSSQRSTQRTADWVKRTGIAEISGEDVVGKTSTPPTLNDDQLENANSSNAQEVHPSSTPLGTPAALVPQAVHDATELEDKSIPGTVQSLTFHNPEDSTAGTVGNGDGGKLPNLSHVNLQPFPSMDMLKMEVVSATNSGMLPKLNRPCYKRWSVETGELRKQNALQRQAETDARMIQELNAKHQLEVDEGRRREVDLINKIRSLESQNATERNRIRESEEGLRDQLEQRTQQQAALRSDINLLKKQHGEQIELLKKQYGEEIDKLNSRHGPQQAALRDTIKHLEKEIELQRMSAVDLRKQFDQRNQYCAELQHQVVDLENEIRLLREAEKTSQVARDAANEREVEAMRPRRRTEKDGLEPRESAQEEVQGNNRAGNDRQSVLGPNPGLVPHNTLGNLGPSPQQLAARQVVTKELPVFSGDPVDWPLFTSSYQNSTELCGYSDAENLLRLQRSLRGAAKDAVSSFLLHPSTVPQIVSTLQQLYGRPEQIVNNMIAKVRSVPPPKADRLETLVSFGLVVQNLCGHLKAVGLEKHLSNPILLQELVDKLPATVKFSWALYQDQVPLADLQVFSDYMGKVLSAASGVTQHVGVPQKFVKEERSKPKEKSFVNTHIPTDQQIGKRREEAENGVPSDRVQKPRDGGTRNKSCVVCNRDCHGLKNCVAFKALDIDSKWKAVKTHRLCSRCLMPHARWPCKGEICGVNGCPKRHHRSLHFEPPVESKYTGAVVSVHRQPSSSTLFRILPVTLFGQNGQLNTYAFLDDGSSVTLVERSIADALGARGDVETLHLQWTGGINKKITGAEVVTMDIAEMGGRKRFKLTDVYTVGNLGLPQQTLNFTELATRFDHLKNLPVKGFDSAVPGILIGLSNAHLLATLKLRQGRSDEPIATKTRIGWAICGSLRKPIVHRQLHMNTEPSNAELHEYVKHFFDIESLGVAAAATVKGVEEQRAYKILAETTRRQENGKFETGLLWNHDYVEFPDSRPMAERRFKCLEKRLARNPALYDSVRQQIVDFKSKGYIHEATKEELDGYDLRRTWYLPIGVVVNEKKPGKIRVIWDAAAKVDGVSLNSMLLKGPDLLTPLLSALFQYRERQVAVSADVKEMFLQIMVRAQDRSALLFPYRDSPELPMSIMVSDVAIFGAACSPTQSQYIKNLNASEHELEFPRGAAAVIKKHYVDDYVDSFDTAEEAIEVAKEVIEIHRRAGFHIRNWMSSNRFVLDSLGEANLKQSKAMLPDKETAFERVLGMAWQQDEDIFTFSLQFSERVQNLMDGTTIPTKREMLRLVMSIFDPLGLVGSFVIHGKILIQEVWRSNTEWDSRIPMNIATRWMEWTAALKQMEGIRIPRCYFPNYHPDSFKSLELHVFVDASEQAYAAVAYFRIVDNGQVRVALVSSKTKVAPLRGLSIPRMELMAALLGARLRKTIEESHSLTIRKTYFWSDSSTVCSWIKSDVRRYRQFVAFRVNEILSLSSIDEWQWISTKVNVADEATKWGKGPVCNVDSRWFRGPDILYENERASTTIAEEAIDESDKELREAHVHSHLVRHPVIDVDRFSKFERLLRSTAYVHRFADRVRSLGGSTDTVGLTSEEIRKAERTLWMTAQTEAFPDEVFILKKNREEGRTGGKQLGSSSKLFKLSPFLDEHGVLREATRAAEAEILSYDQKFPIILPRKHRITELLLDYYHRKYRHANDETVVNELRQRFSVSRLRVEVRMSRKRCIWCRVYKAMPVAPKMGPLPSVRLEPFVRPFSYVGVDLFGPYLVKIGRGVAKRWVCLFTCLTIRAIHLEVVASLSTDACKKAIRRFIARRGSPQVIYSDNGTNFVGANRELQEEMKRINEELGSTFTNAHTQWRFNPPAAPHMGGCWERMVRAVKAALAFVPVVRKLDDESFATALVEAESMVNSRPLTFVPLDTANRASLTPNDFLLLSSNGVREPEKFPTDSGMALRSSWNLVKHTLDNIWRRWVREYLPTITRRTKWFQDVAPIKVGDLVLVVDENVRNRWLRGRVVRAFPGKDGVIRRAEVRTSGGLLKRPATKLALLDVVSSGAAKSEVVATRGGGCSPQQPLVAFATNGNRRDTLIPTVDTNISTVMT